MLIGGALIWIGFSVKFLAAPLFLFVCLTPLTASSLKDHHWLYLSLCAIGAGLNYDLWWNRPIIGLTFQGGLRIPEIDWLPVASGWSKLIELHNMGMSEGKFEQLALALAAIFPFVKYKKKWRIFLLGLCSVIILCVCAFVLEDRIRMRLLAPASFGLVVVLSASAGKIFQNFRLSKWWLLPISIFLLLDTWSFLYSFGERQQKWSLNDPHSFPKPPKPWSEQYTDNISIFKDISLYGGAGAHQIIAEHKNSANRIYSMRLRDEREESLYTYAMLQGLDFERINPTVCCSTADFKCARSVLTQAQQSGALTLLPLKKAPWLRVHKNEARWYDLLLKAGKSLDQMQERDSWLVLPPTGTSGPPPCLNTAGQRNNNRRLSP